MIFGTFTSVFAAVTTEEVTKVEGIENKVQYLLDFDYVEGYADGELKLDQNINRAEITKLIVHAEGYKALAERLQGVMKLYTDVDTSHWANGVITVGTTTEAKANNLEMLNGYPNGTFKPAQDVTYAKLAKMLVVLVKEDLTEAMHDRANTPQRWAGDWMLWAEELGILEDVKVENSNAAASRRDAFVMMYNAMYKMKFVDRVPANETMGIVSDFDNHNEKLTLNQGDFKKEFNLKADTTYVRYTSYDAKEAKTYKLKDYFEDIYNYSFGSLVRVLADDKGNVTHIVELGNEKGAMNSVNWTDIAEKTTTKLAVGKFEDDNMFNIDNKDLELTQATRYFIADPARGRLSEVTKADAQEYGVQDKAIKSVYAGYDVLKGRTPLKEAKEAKVVVYTKATKDADTGRMLRVLRQQNNNYEIQLEDTKGKKETLSTRTNSTLYPFIDALYNRIGVKLQGYDVVKVQDNIVNGSTVDVVIRHKDTKNFPIVKVIDVDGRNIQVQAADKDITGWIRLAADYGQFLETEKLMDKHIQYRISDKKHNVADVISIVDADLKGELTLVDYKDAQLLEGKLIKVNEKGHTIVVKLDDAKYGRTDIFEVNADDVEGLKLLMKEENRKLSFRVRKGNNYDYLAHSFKYVVNAMKPLEPTVQEVEARNAAVKALEDKIEEAKKIENWEQDADLKKAVELAEWRVAQKDYTTEQLTYAANQLQTAITAYEDAKAEAKAKAGDLAGYKAEVATTELELTPLADAAAKDAVKDVEVKAFEIDENGSKKASIGIDGSTNKLVLVDKDGKEIAADAKNTLKIVSNNKVESQNVGTGYVQVKVGSLTVDTLEFTVTNSAPIADTVSFDSLGIVLGTAGEVPSNDTNFNKTTKLQAALKGLVTLKDQFGNKIADTCNLTFTTNVTNVKGFNADLTELTAQNASATIVVSKITDTSSGDENLISSPVVIQLSAKDTKAVEITGVEDGKLYNENKTPATTDTDIKTVTLTKDCAKVDSYTTLAEITEDGKYVLTVEDNAGNKTVVNFEIDKTKPTVAIAETTGATNGATKLVVTYGEELYNDGTVIANGANVKALFAYDGNADLYKTAVYCKVAKTVTFTFDAGAEDSQKLTTDAKVTDKAGNAPASTVFTYAESGTIWSKN